MHHFRATIAINICIGVAPEAVTSWTTSALSQYSPRPVKIYNERLFVGAVILRRARLSLDFLFRFFVRFLFEKRDIMILLYFVIWLTVNGRITTETVIVGAIVSAALHLLSRSFPSARPLPFFSVLHHIPGGLFYLLLLLVEIVKANLQVIRLVLSPVIEVEPCLVRFRTDLRTEAARVALANSITLTPGTLTVSLKGNNLLIHALDRGMARGLDESALVRQLRRMEGTKRAKEVGSDA